MSEGTQGYPALSWGWRLSILAVVVLQFLVAHGPVWKTQFNWNAAILYSYISIPVLVALALAFTRRLAPVAWFLHTLEVSGMKFVITAATLIVLLTTTPNEPITLGSATVQALSRATPFVQPEPKPPKPPLGAVGELKGRVLAADGTPLLGALVFLQGHVEDFGYATATQTVTIANDGQAFHPPLTAARWGQPVELRSTDKRLHTALVSPLGADSKANIPLLADGTAASLKIPGFHGVAEIRCTVHGALEAPAHLGLFSHPYFAFSDSEGAFSLSSVPVGATKVFAFRPGLGLLERPVQISASSVASVELRY